MSAPARPPGALAADDPRSPKYWLYERSGLVALAVASFIQAPMDVSDSDIDILRAYVTQWIDSPSWDGNPHADARSREALAALRSEARLIRTPRALLVWLTVATREGFDPL